MNGRSGFNGLGRGFGPPTPALAKIFREARRSQNEAMKPELDKVVQDYAGQIMAYFESNDASPDQDELEDMLRDFAHEMEEAEGEDPKELDVGGPSAGTVKK